MCFIIIFFFSLHFFFLNICRCVCICICSLRECVGGFGLVYMSVGQHVYECTCVYICVHVHARMWPL